MLTSVCQILQNRTLCCSAIHVFCSLLAVLRQIVGDPKNNEMRRAQFSRASYITMSYSKTQPPDFPPKGSRHFVSNFLLSAGILAQYKTFHVSFKKYLYL